MSLVKIKEVLKFIKNFKKEDKTAMENVFTHGCCFWFAEILEIRFSGEIYFNPDLVHFATLIEDQLFDINGLIDADDSWFNWEDYKTKNDTLSIFHTCILKDY